jgi:hypothetical protein
MIMAGAPPPRPSSASERNKLIAEFEASRRSEAERHSTEEARATRRKRVTRLTALGAALAIALVLAFRPPAWILPPPVPTPTPAEREASIRFAMYLQAQQIEHFRATRGRLPSQSGEAGPPLPGVQYIVLGGASYQLRSTTDSTIRYNSTDSLLAFLGGSMAHLGPSQ